MGKFGGRGGVKPGTSKRVGGVVIPGTSKGVGKGGGCQAPERDGGWEGERGLKWY